VTNGINAGDNYLLHLCVYYLFWKCGVQMLPSEYKLYRIGGGYVLPNKTGNKLGRGLMNPTPEPQEYRLLLHQAAAFERDVL
jgi:hypothetical protein